MICSGKAVARRTLIQIRGNRLLSRPCPSLQVHLHELQELLRKSQRLRLLSCIGGGLASWNAVTRGVLFATTCKRETTGHPYLSTLPPERNKGPAKFLL